MLLNLLAGGRGGEGSILSVTQVLAGENFQMIERQSCCRCCFLLLMLFFLWLMMLFLFVILFLEKLASFDKNAEVIGFEIDGFLGSVNFFSFFDISWVGGTWGACCEK